MLLQQTPGNLTLLTIQEPDSQGVTPGQIPTLSFPMCHFPLRHLAWSPVPLRKRDPWQDSALFLAALSQAWTQLPLLLALSTVEPVWNFPSASPKMTAEEEKVNKHREMGQESKIRVISKA